MARVPIRFDVVTQWPGTPTRDRRRSLFKSTVTKVWDELDRELWMIGAQDVVLRGFWTERMIRQDGQLRADARPSEPGVILQFRKGAEQCEFPADGFKTWQDNVDAIARSLGGLRMIDRYCVRPGAQYVGYRQIAAESSTRMKDGDILEALAKLAQMGHLNVRAFDGEQIVNLSRKAKYHTHPDRGGDPADFRKACDLSILLGL